MTSDASVHLTGPRQVFFAALARLLINTRLDVSFTCQTGNKVLYGMDINKINTAVQPLLEACYVADDPQARLRAELDRLRATGNWLEMELRQLQILTLDSVKRMVERP